GANVTVGLSDGTGGTDANQIKFGLRFYPGSPGYVEVRESGVYRADWSLVTGAAHRVAVEARALKYYQGGALKFARTAAPTRPLLVGSTLTTTGSAVQNAVINTGSMGGGGGGGGASGPQNVVWTNAVNVAVSGNVITKNAGCDGCWDAGASSQQM